MAKKIVKVNEEKIRGYMVGDIPDAIENEDIIVVDMMGQISEILKYNRKQKLIRVLGGIVE